MESGPPETPTRIRSPAATIAWPAMVCRTAVSSWWGSDVFEDGGMNQFGVFSIPITDVSTTDGHFGHVVTQGADSNGDGRAIHLAGLDGGFTGGLGLFIDVYFKIVQCLDRGVFRVLEVTGIGTNQFPLNPGVYTGAGTGANHQSGATGGDHKGEQQQNGIYGT
ncbi:hypothetical protein DESC_480127 [Desulfosarcina cetonica]|nr:hypothetical protein DESC_480127 [Desulfosarcina cetonica]